jgi:glycosyltransferase involved in cell wall biosynthesis
MADFLSQLRNRMRGASRNEHTDADVRTEIEARKAMQLFMTSGLFANEWYLETNPDLVAAGANPVQHFLEHGWREGRLPNPYFDTVWYLKKYADVATSGMNPLIHYWRYGERENRQPCPIFDTEWYRETYKADVGPGSALGHYLQHRHLRRFSPNRYFDIEFYLRANPDVAEAGVDPVEHFVRNGYREGRNPSSSFDVSYYSRLYLQEDNRDPLTHYFEVGRAAGYSTYRDPTRATQASELRRFTSRSADFEEVRPRIGSRQRAKVLAFYLPQFHSFPENDKWWGKGFTEWTNIARGTPRFEGHYQPRIPRDLGFYDLTDPRILPKQVEMAKAAGLFGFCYYYYNFNGTRLLHRPVESFLQRPEIDFPFCLLWANENWTRRWDGAESEILIQQDYRNNDAASFVADIARHFRDPRYIRVKGRPLLFLYRPDVIPNARDTLAQWRVLFRSEHGEDPWIFMVQGFENHDPTVFGFDGAIEFPPHKVAKDIPTLNSKCDIFDENFTARVCSYDDVVGAATSEPVPAFPLIKTVFPSWDNDARRQGQGMVVTGSTPAKYSQWLDQAIVHAIRNPFEGESFAFINAWNEWAEGTYLEPDIHFGAAYLNATARAISGVGLSREHRKILLVGHDACNHGAQLLLLSLAKTMKRQFGLDVRVLLRADGDLLPDYREVCPVTVAAGAQALGSAVNAASKEGISFAITNTVVTGDVVPLLKNVRMHVTSLVHEMPRLIAERNLSSRAMALSQSADEVVFPSDAVRDAFHQHVHVPSVAESVQPQGIYNRAQFDPEARASVLRELSLPSDAKIVINVGYGDMRKGIDLFCSVAREVRRKLPNAFFVWVGKVDPLIGVWYEKELKSENVRFLGQRADVGRLLSSANLFALTSREDPFPSVLLEALCVGLPVVAFDSGGGFVDLIRDGDFGELVAFADPSAMARAIVRQLKRDPVDVAILAERNRRETSSRFLFEDYAFDLVTRADKALKRVSVIVPNYNYAKYLSDRLATVFDQTYPVFEVIVLDDASNDESVETVKQAADAAQRDIVLIRNDVNSGNVFKQWAKGALLARGDLVWIAEADDLADPHFLERLVQFFDDTGTAFAFSDSSAIDGVGRQIGESYKTYYSRLFDGALSDDLQDDARLFAVKFLAQRNTILNVSSVVWRRERLVAALRSTENNLRDFKLAGDWLLYLAACSDGGTVGYCSAPLNQHRRHAGGVTSQTAAERQLTEIGRIHAYCNSTFEVTSDTLASQNSYIDELKEQFGLVDLDNDEVENESA